LVWDNHLPSDQVIKSVPIYYELYTSTVPGVQERKITC
jgi:hypothetical protein